MAMMLMLAPSGLNMNVARSRTAVQSQLMRAYSRVADVSMIELEEAGEFGTTDYTMTFKEGGKVSTTPM